MISTLAMACVIFREFWKIMTIAISPRYYWDVPPLALMFIVAISAGAFGAMLHRKLT